MNNKIEKIFNTIRELPSEKVVLFEKIFYDLLTDDISEIKSNLTLISVLSKKYLGKNTRYLIVETEFGLIAVDPEDSVVGYELRTSGKYERDVYAILEKITTLETNLLILGAHIGSHLIPISKKVKRVLAVEANPETFKLLSINILLNNILNCEIFNCALADKNGTIPFIMNTVNSGGSKRKPLVFDNMYYYDLPKEKMLNSVRLDDIIPKNYNYDVAIMDLEGSEYFALIGMRNTLKNLKVLLMEYVPHHLKNVACITPIDLVEHLQDFNHLLIPSLNTSVGKGEFLNTLQFMYDNNLIDDGLVFSKEDLSSVLLH
jgi:FkbM family methyltransferase